MARPTIHPYQCLAVAVSNNGNTKTLFLAAGNELFAVNPEDGSRRATWQAGDQHAKMTITHLAVSHDAQHLAAATDNDKSIHIFSVPADHSLVHLYTRRMPKRLSAIAFHPSEPHILCGDKFGDVYALPIQEATRVSDTWSSNATSNNGTTKESFSVEKSDKGNPNPPKKRKMSKPAASELTVHSQRNLKALQHQNAQAEQTKADDGDEDEDSFVPEHKPLLGHVSMLTDLVAARVNLELKDLQHFDEDGFISERVTPIKRRGDLGDYIDGLRGLGDIVMKKRDYIFTSDRDEHIRVSRGSLDHAHIIERFCLGHKQFVGKLLLPRADILVSGGGDDFLLVWNWLKGELMCKIDVKKDLGDHLGGHNGGGGGGGGGHNDIDKILKGNIAVSGLRTIPPPTGEEEDGQGNAAVSFLVALEGTNLLFWYSSTSKFNHPNKAYAYFDLLAILRPPGNVLDLAVLPIPSRNSKYVERALVFVSLDSLHEICSTDIPRKSLHDENIPSGERLVKYYFDGIEVKQVPHSDECEKLCPTIDIPTDESQTAKALEPLRQLLYPSAGLRKRACTGDGRN